MLRDEYLAPNDEQSVWPVLVHERPRQADPLPEAAEASEFRAEAAAPDVPASIGMLLFAVYFALIAALAIATAGPGESKMVLTIAGLFVVAFFTVPRFIFAQEPKRASAESQPFPGDRHAHSYRSLHRQCGDGADVCRPRCADVRHPRDRRRNRADFLDAERHSDELWQAFDLHLGHDVGAIDLDRADADAEFEGDDLIGLAFDQPVEDFALALRQ